MRQSSSLVAVTVGIILLSASAAKADAWDVANNPSRIDGSFVYEVGSLPIEGAPKLPISPSDYWEGYDDGIRYGWAVVSLAPLSGSVNAGAFHVIAANIVGLRKGSFAYDRTVANEVWSQPVVRFRVTSSPVKEIKRSDIKAFLRRFALNGQQVSTFATRFFELETDFSYVSDAASLDPGLRFDPQYSSVDHFHYLLEADVKGRITGGIWLDNNAVTRPQRLRFPFP